MNRSEILKSIEGYVANTISEQDDLDVALVKPIQLLSKKRLDIVAKYVFARSRVLGSFDEWSELVYKEHLRAMNSFIEKNNNKNSYDDFKKSYEQTIISIKKEWI